MPSEPLTPSDGLLENKFSVQQIDSYAVRTAAAVGDEDLGFKTSADVLQAITINLLSQCFLTYKVPRLRKFCLSEYN